MISSLTDLFLLHINLRKSSYENDFFMPEHLWGALFGRTFVVFEQVVVRAQEEHPTLSFTMVPEQPWQVRDIVLNLCKQSSVCL